MESFTMKDMKKGFDDLSYAVMGAAIEVHRYLGPGLLESAYQQCLAPELQLNHIDFNVEVLKHGIKSSVL